VKAVVAVEGESYCSRAELEGGLSYAESLVACRDDDDDDAAWIKARLSWTTGPDDVSHYLVWTCCPSDRLRTMSAVDCTTNAALLSRSAADSGSVSATVTIILSNLINQSVNQSGIFKLA